MQCWTYLKQTMKAETRAGRGEQQAKRKARCPEDKAFSEHKEKKLSPGFLH